MSVTAVTCMIAFWVSAVVVGYTWVGYPLILALFSRWFGRWTRAPRGGEVSLPGVSLLIAAHNEEAVIGQRLRNALNLDYPADKIEIVVVADGCTDETTTIVNRFARQGVRLIEREQRRGKASAINAAWDELHGDIVLLSDANTEMEQDAVRKLVRWFRNPKVGVVCGRLQLTDPASGNNVDSLYWKYETHLKQWEGRLGALPGANGGIYAIRKELFRSLPENTLLDDLVIPMTARLHNTCVLVYDAEAVAHEEAAPDVAAEFRRRARIGAGGYQCLGRLWPILDPRQGWIAWTFMSHKLLRWLCPFFLLLLLVSNLLLVNRPFYLMTLLVLSAGTLTGLVAGFLPGRWRILRPLRLLSMFVAMNLAIFVGFWHWLFQPQQGTWQRTPRMAESEVTCS